MRGFLAKVDMLFCHVFMTLAVAFQASSECPSNSNVSNKLPNSLSGSCVFGSTALSFLGGSVLMCVIRSSS